MGWIERGEGKYCREEKEIVVLLRKNWGPREWVFLEKKFFAG